MDFLSQAGYNTLVSYTYHSAPLPNITTWLDGCGQRDMQVAATLLVLTVDLSLSFETGGDISQGMVQPS
jgi:hypothetical protein